MPANDSDSGHPVAPAGVLFRHRRSRRPRPAAPWSPQRTETSNPVVPDDASSQTPVPAGDALHTNFDLEKLLDGDSDDESDGTPDVLGDANLPGIHELSDLGDD